MDRSNHLDMAITGTTTSIHEYKFCIALLEHMLPTNSWKLSLPKINTFDCFASKNYSLRKHQLTSLSKISFHTVCFPVTSSYQVSHWFILLEGYRWNPHQIDDQSFAPTGKRGLPLSFVLPTRSKTCPASHLLSLSLFLPLPGLLILCLRSSSFCIKMKNAWKLRDNIKVNKGTKFRFLRRNITAAFVVRINLPLIGGVILYLHKINETPSFSLSNYRWAINVMNTVIPMSLKWVVHLKSGGLFPLPDK